MNLVHLMQGGDLRRTVISKPVKLSNLWDALGKLLAAKVPHDISTMGRGPILTSNRDLGQSMESSSKLRSMLKILIAEVSLAFRKVDSLK
jgi:hypothetical protein